MEPRQKRTTTKAKASNALTTPVRRSSRVASRLGWRIPPEILLLIMNEIRNSVHSLKIATLVCPSHVSRLIVVEYDERALTPAYTFMKNDWLMGRQLP
ncbi:hypothetical protein VKT23_019146 [Stygiomarasmius scandens]|uniref:F-box domain-containing protein n=1 Tax=Marasmiellus scandens TaxID=2682957 RepID=A0ABR1IMB6_9AGAR